jgi:DNA transposition AAA+ family ATPase
MADIETTGVVVEESESETIPEDLRPVFTIAGAIEWTKKPENEAKIRETMRAIDVETRRLTEVIEDHVTAAGKLLIDCLEHDDVASALGESLLDSILGRGE